MRKNELIQLTNNLYKTTLLFPKKEPLRFKMREIANEILAKIGQKCFLQLDVLDSFFEVAREQNWVKTEEILHLQKEYSKLKQELKTQEIPEPAQKIPEPKEKTITNELDDVSLSYSQVNERQKRIIQVLKNKGKAQVGDLSKILSRVTKRTLRRDFESLLKQGLVQRIGERQGTYYKLNG